MNWLERARREIPKSARRRTANSAERTLTAVMAVLHPGLWEKSAASIGSNGSTSPSHLLESESMREAYEERAAIMEFDGGLAATTPSVKPGRWCRNAIGWTEGKSMARKKQSYIKGTFTHRRTEADYMGVLLDAVPLEEWREVVSATVAAAKAGDATARAWLAQYLVGKPSTTAPAPLTVIVQQLSGRDPLTERLAKPHIDRAKYPSLGANDDFDDAMRELIAGELRALEAQKSNTPETGANAGGTRLSADSSGS